MTETEICNLALSKIGGAGDQQAGSGFIESIDDDNRVSRRCLFLFPVCRKMTLERLADNDAAPTEAKEFCDLGAESSTDLKMGGYEYVFNLDPDTIRVLRQIDEEFATVPNNITDRIKTYPFSVRFDGTTQKFFTNDLTNEDGDSAFIERCFDQPNTATWSMAFINAHATLLAAELCPIIGASAAERRRLMAEFETLTLPNAFAHSGAQDDDYKREPADYSGGRNKTLTLP